ncbi:hypothetical protein, partial [Burkholderia gladioli]|uniref:hypothetical protein n=1 Tax=Burkholderia gladioli TaxID=28095 RepID=UPI0019D6ECE0
PAHRRLFPIASGHAWRLAAHAFHPHVPFSRAMFERMKFPLDLARLRTYDASIREVSHRTTTDKI